MEGTCSSWLGIRARRALWRRSLPARRQNRYNLASRPELTNVTIAGNAAGGTEGETARIEVQNGTGWVQLAAIAADQLRWEGFKIAGTGPAERDDYQKTQILVLNDRPEAVARLARLLQSKPANIIQQPDAGQPADLRVVLGSDFDPCR